MKQRAVFQVGVCFRELPTHIDALIFHNICNSNELEYFEYKVSNVYFVAVFFVSYEQFVLPISA